MEVSEIMETLNKYSKNYEWFNSNYEKLKKEYPNMIVAVDQDEVIASDTNPETIKEKTRDRLGVFVSAVLTDKLIWIL